MFVLVESTKEKYEDEIITKIVSVSDNKEILSRFLEDEIKKKLSDAPTEVADKAISDFEANKKQGYSGVNVISDSGEYIDVRFDENGMLYFYSTGCPSNMDSVVKTKEIHQITNIDTIDDFRGAYSFLSNFYSCDIDYDGENYTSSECAFQAMKESDKSKRGNWSHLSPSEAKKKGRKCKLRSDWEEVKVNIMFDILKAKFSDEDLKTRLLLTGDKPLIEGNQWHDNFWGNCTCRKCEGIKGKNMLGKLLMKLRSEIRVNEQNAK